MEPMKVENMWNVSLPWSDGTLSARMWRKGTGLMVGVPELDIFCYGKSETEAVMRLFSSLLKYYNDLKSRRNALSERQREHFDLLKIWVQGVEKKMTAPEPVSISSRRLRN